MKYRLNRLDFFLYFNFKQSIKNVWYWTISVRFWTMLKILTLYKNVVKYMYLKFLKNKNLKKWIFTEKIIRARQEIHNTLYRAPLKMVFMVIITFEYNISSTALLASYLTKKKWSTLYLPLFFLIFETLTSIFIRVLIGL